MSSTFFRAPMHVYSHAYIHMYVYMYVYIYIHTYICIYRHMYVYVCLYVYAHMYILHLCVYIYIHIHNHSHSCNQRDRVKQRANSLPDDLSHSWLVLLLGHVHKGSMRVLCTGSMIRYRLSDPVGGSFSRCRCGFGIFGLRPYGRSRALWEASTHERP